MTNDNERRSIKSDDTLFNIVEFIQANKITGITEIANSLNIAKGTVHAHLVTLEQRGYIVNDNGEYKIGLQFLQHGVHAQNTNPLYQLANEKVMQLAEETGERAWCQVEENGFAYYLCGAEGEHSVHPPVKIGARVPLHQIAGGKAILAYLPDDRIHEIIERSGLPAQTENTITEVSSLFDELETIRKRGFAYNIEESLRGLHAVGAPIRDHNGEILGALSISGPANRLKGQTLEEEIPELLLGTTNELEINLTYTE